MHWIVFDYGEVISRPTGALPALSEVLGADLVKFEDAYWAERDAYDRGLSDHSYWSAVGDRLGTAVSPGLAARLTEIDTHGWMSVEPSTMELLADLRATGTRLALLSNAPAAFGRLVEQAAWSSTFEHLLFSGDLGMAKPDAEIWAALLARIEADAGDCVFFDDRQVNIDGAVAYGISGQLWHTAAQAREHLAAVGIL